MIYVDFTVSVETLLYMFNAVCVRERGRDKEQGHPEGHPEGSQAQACQDQRQKQAQPQRYSEGLYQPGLENNCNPLMVCNK